LPVWAFNQFLEIQSAETEKEKFMGLKDMKKILGGT